MTPAEPRAGECPSWVSLARFVAEGGPWPVEHLRTCRRCSERRAFLEGMSLLRMDEPSTTSSASECPDMEDVIALAEGRLTSARRSAVAAHLSDCDACAALFRELVALSETEEREWELRDAELSSAVLPRPESSLPRHSRFWGARAVALIVLAVALAAVYYVPFPAIDTGVDSRWRGPAPRLEASVEWPERSAAPVLVWEGREAATSYRIRVWEERGTRVFERHVAAGETTRVALPVPEAEPGDVVLWQLDALDNGEVLATTSPTELTWRGQ